MLIKDLKEKLNEYPDDMEVVSAFTGFGVNSGPFSGPVETSVDANVQLTEALVKAELRGEKPVYFFGDSWGKLLNHPDLADRRVLMIS
jgi:hypothetical protein